MFRAFGGREQLGQSQSRSLQCSKRQVDPSVLAQPLTCLPGVGPVVARKLASLGLVCLQDLLLYLPFRHEPAARLCTVSELRSGETATIRVQVRACSVYRARNRNLKILEALVSDHTGSVLAVWYNQAHLEQVFSSHPELLIRGVLTTRGRPPRLVVQSYEVLGRQEAGVHTLGLIPVYPASGDVSVRLIRNTVAKAKPYARHLVDPLPPSILAERRFPSRAEAVLTCHFPVSEREAQLARERLAFEELLLLQIALLWRRRKAKSANAPHLGPPGPMVSEFLSRLPYRLTKAQLRVIEEIEQDLQSTRPMLRLLQGDVGAGKTLIAAYALLRAVESGGQGAMMVPTEVLADQHEFCLSRLLRPLGLRISVLKNGLSQAERRRVLRGLCNGEVRLVVGTHALIQRGVSFKDLRVAVIDEQHRFGVRQRDALATAGGKGRRPHVLHMTATPIPRTLGLTLYGDLDISVLDDLPPGRQPISTGVVPKAQEEQAWQFVRERLTAGEQAYIVCPLIEEGESQAGHAATAVFKDLVHGQLAGFKLGLLHGGLSSAVKQQVMNDFSRGAIHALVATTVIEVGIDVPNATVMVILGAHRFGLSQLHQLRGRVGRGDKPSHCLLFLDDEREADDRLSLFVSTTDGFELAEADLRLRGEGQVFGERQSGLSDLKIARLLRDYRLLLDARGVAQNLLERDPEGRDPSLALLWQAAHERFGAVEHWLDKV